MTRIHPVSLFVKHVFNHAKFRLKNNKNGEYCENLQRCIQLLWGFAILLWVQDPSGNGIWLHKLLRFWLDSRHETYWSVNSHDRSRIKMGESRGLCLVKLISELFPRLLLLWTVSLRYLCGNTTLVYFVHIRWNVFACICNSTFPVNYSIISALPCFRWVLLLQNRYPLTHPLLAFLKVQPQIFKVQVLRGWDFKTFNPRKLTVPGDMTGYDEWVQK